ncbi:hypothetical protein HMPREF3027_02205 [Porphyromonas sp. HMSC077F02]|nr:hypothetical protein HMPREF3027_02205 [Porphyromonas sp. HMSC077F02]
MYMDMKFMHYRYMKRVVSLLGLMSLVILALLQGCAPKEDDITIPNITPSIQVLKANASGGTFTIDIKSNVKWDVVGEWTDWYLASKMDDHTLSVVIDENKTAQDRQTTILLDAQDCEVRIPIIQRERVEITLKEHEIYLSAKAEERRVKVESNYAEWSVKSSEAWLTVTKEEGNFFTLITDENKSTEDPRKAIVTLTADGKEERIVVQQDYATVITLSKSAIAFPWQGGEEQIEISSNKEVRISSENALPSIFTLTEENESPNIIKVNIKMRRYDYERPLNFNLNVSATDLVVPISITVEASMFNRNQREALKALYVATDGDNWIRNDNWLSDKPVTEWYGIVGFDGTQIPEIDPKLSVTTLNLDNNNLVGEIPKEIGLLDDVMFLRLSGNHLHGSVPEELSSINNLFELDLSNNELGGMLPPFLFKDLPLTRVLKLNDNNFEGYLDLDNLIPPKTKLSRIELQMNRLHGPRPKQLNSRNIKLIIDPQKDNYGFE